MVWRIELADSAAKQLSKLGRVEAQRVTTFLRERFAVADNPRFSGKALTGEFGGLWRYRVGDCRVICEFHDATVTVLIVKIGARREIYR